jgi:hypothetical protein
MILPPHRNEAPWPPSLLPTSDGLLPGVAVQNSFAFPLSTRQGKDFRRSVYNAASSGHNVFKPDERVNSTKGMALGS